MARNPIVFTEKVFRSFLRYQLTAYPFADERLMTQMRKLLSLHDTHQSPLLKVRTSACPGRSSAGPRLTFDGLCVGQVTLDPRLVPWSDLLPGDTVKHTADLVAIALRQSGRCSVDK